MGVAIQDLSVGFDSVRGPLPLQFALTFRFLPRVSPFDLDTTQGLWFVEFIVLPGVKCLPVGMTLSLTGVRGQERLQKGSTSGYLLRTTGSGYFGPKIYKEVLSYPFPE